MLYRQFYSWADSNTLLLIYWTYIRPHLEYMPANSGTHSWRRACSHWKLCKNLHVKSVSISGTWTMSDSMLQLLNLPSLSVRRKYLKLTTTYNIVSGHVDSLLVSLYKVIYHTTLIVQVHLILLDLLHILITCITHLFLLQFPLGTICLTQLKYVFVSPPLKDPCCITLRHMYHTSYQLHSCYLCHLWHKLILYKKKKIINKKIQHGGRPKSPLCGGRHFAFHCISGLNE